MLSLRYGKEMNSKSDWYVITGGFSSGKSTVLSCFEKMGYKTIPDAARILIDEEMAVGKTIEEIRRNEREFQQKVLAIKLRVENKLSGNQIIFFDRAIPDSAAYYQICGLNPKEVLDVCQKGQYEKVFFMEQLPLIKDYARTEDSQTAKRLNQFLKQTYKQLGYKVIFVPVMSIKKRVKFIQSRL